MGSRIGWVVGSLMMAAAGGAHAAGNVVISQVYGGGGNSNAPLQNDFVELFNRSAAPVNLVRPVRPVCECLRHRKLRRPAHPGAVRHIAARPVLPHQAREQWRGRLGAPEC